MRHISWAFLLAAIGCSDETQVTQPVAAAADLTAERHYKIEKLPSLGGTVSLGTGINNRGWVAGFSNLDEQTRHAVLWRDGVIEDLGTLGGPNSNAQWPGLNNQGVVVGISETTAIDPLGEDWSCAAFIPATDRTCVGFVWDDGEMTPLPTLGGHNGFATGVNSRGQVVGWAETLVHDPTCNETQVLQFRAVLWEPKNGVTQELPPLPGDSTSAATAINQRGQVVGISGECDVAVGRFSARHAVLWEKGSVVELPNLGGESWHTPMAINEAGAVVGFSNPPGDEDGAFIPHAFLWTKTGGIEDLGTFPGDDFSQAFAVNDRRQVVGRSCGGAGCRAVLWEDGAMKDLTELAGPGYPDVLLSARAINDAGTITGNVLERSTGKTLAFVARPRGDKR